jgi:hypothetical protein
MVLWTWYSEENTVNDTSGGTDDEENVIIMGSDR